MYRQVYNIGDKRHLEYFILVAQICSVWRFDRPEQLFGNCDFKMSLRTNRQWNKTFVEWNNVGVFMLPLLGRPRLYVPVPNWCTGNRVVHWWCCLRLSSHITLHFLAQFQALPGEFVADCDYKVCRTCCSNVRFVLPVRVDSCQNHGSAYCCEWFWCVGAEKSPGLLDEGLTYFQGHSRDSVLTQCCQILHFSVSKMLIG